MKFDDYWKVPKDSKKYFSPKQEKELKEKYGVFYTLHTILCVAILIIPFFVFLFLAPENAFQTTTTSGNLCGALGGFLGLIGSLSIGVGFVNIFMALIKQYLGHFVTVIAIVGGLIVDMLGLLVFSFIK